MSKTVVVKDFGYDKHIKLQAEIARHEIAVGILPSAGQDTVNHAVWNHYGTRRNGKPHIPERPFLASAINEFEDRIFQRTQIHLRTIRQSSDIRPMLGTIGRFVSDRIRDSIIDFDNPPNAPSTIKAKGFNDPLIETGKLRDATDFEIRKAGETS